MPELWSRRPDETDRAWAAFTIFRDLGPARSINEAYRRHSKKNPGDTSKIPPYFHKFWPKKYEWKARASAYDLYLDELKRDHVEQALVSQAVVESELVDESLVWERRRYASRNKMYELGESMLVQAREMIDYPVVQQKLVAADGTYVVMPAKWYDKQVAASLAKAGCELIQRAIGSVMLPEQQAEATAIEQKAMLPDWLQQAIKKDNEQRVIDVDPDTGDVEHKVNGRDLHDSVN